MAYTAVATAVK